MNKPPLPGQTVKQALRARAQDRLHRFTLADGKIRGAIVKAAQMVNEMRVAHQLGILETLILGQAYMGAGLMAMDLKGDHYLRLQVSCSGPVQGLNVEANAYGEVRGHLKQVPIPIDKPMQSFDTSPFFGAGFLSVTKTLEDAKQPFTGQVMLESGNLARDLAAYYLQSEQIPTAFHLSIKFDTQGEVTGAGGLFLQIMPGASEAQCEKIDTLVKALPSLGEAFAENQMVPDLVRSAFNRLSPRLLSEQRVEFFCRCTDKAIERMFLMLPQADLTDLAHNGPFPAEVRCHNCNTCYAFSKSQLQQFLATKKTE